MVDRALPLRQAQDGAIATPTPVVTAALRILAIGASVAAPDLDVESSPGWADALDRLAGDDAFAALVVDGDLVPASAAEIGAAAERVAIVVVVVDPDAEHAVAWLRQGADDVVGRDEIAGPAGARRIRFAVERRRRRVGREPTYSTDPGTGLRHRQQMVEHLSQLLALREREPAPMAVLAFRIEGLRPGAGGGEGAEAETLRRKIAVRLRAGVRGSDVVAAIDDDAFAVLLGSILTAEDADRVAAKLLAALLAPFSVGMGERSVAVALGIARYPHDGQAAERLLRRSLSLAAAAPATSRAGPATAHDAGGEERAAANDER